MQTTLGRIRWGLLPLLAVIAAPASLVRGETFVRDLNFATAPGGYGEYLTAPFDFGGAFADVQSVRLQLNIPGGYTGTAMRIGNSYYLKTLWIQINDPADPPPSAFLSPYLQTITLYVPPSDASDFEFRRMPNTFDDQIHYDDWPSFLLTGAGEVSLIDLNSSSYRPLFSGEITTPLVSWRAPATVVGARLILEATRIPEPSAALLAILAALGPARRFARPHRSPAAPAMRSRVATRGVFTTPTATG